MTTLSNNVDFCGICRDVESSQPLKQITTYNENNTVLPCHFFHEHCIQEWISHRNQNNSTPICPLCHRKIQIISEKFPISFKTFKSVCSVASAFWKKEPSAYIGDFEKTSFQNWFRKVYEIWGQALIRASKTGQLDEVKEIFSVAKSCVADLFKNDDLSTSLLAAAENGHIEIVKEILHFDKEHRMLLDSDISVAIYHSAPKGQVEIVKELIQHLPSHWETRGLVVFASFVAGIHLKDMSIIVRGAALLSAVNAGNTAAVQSLLQNGEISKEDLEFARAFAKDKPNIFSFLPKETP